MSLGSQKDGLIGDKAADWAARLEQDRRPETLEQFQRWKDADPRHAAAFDAAAAMLEDVGRLRQSSAFGGRQLRSGRLRRQVRGRFALAASIAAIVLLIPMLYLISQSLRTGSDRIEAVMLSTDIGEIRQFPLRDGTRITLDTGSAVRIEIGQDRRRATVERGRVRFAVSRRSVPFQIAAGSAAVSLDQGVVDLTQRNGEIRLDLLAGGVRISSAGGRPTQSATLDAPVTVEQPGTASQHVYPLARREVEWTSGRLSFDGARLADVIAASNRYTHEQIIVRDPSIGELRLTGVIQSGDAARVARTLAAVFHLKVVPRGDDNIELTRP